ncbi:MAG: FAS1 domain-containing protein [Benjaminiella poitrasii]|nr:MAG: FAS1 domain-containing protein [Benjaminiella poitrasii]
MIKLLIVKLLFIYFIVAVNAYKTIIDVLSEDERFSQLIEHLQHTRLVPYLNNLETGTFFAPDNKAFSNYNSDLTRDDLLYHLVLDQHKALDDGQLLESALSRPDWLSTGQLLKSTKHRMIPYINNAKIKQRNIFVNRNTTLYVIDRVLKPPAIVSHVVEQQDDKLFDLMRKCQLDSLLERPESSFTVFVSASYLLDKFKKVEQNYLISQYGMDDLRRMVEYLIIPEPIYLYSQHVGKRSYTTQSGDDLQVNVNANGQVTVNGHRVLEKDILAANGVLHILDDLPYKPNSVQFNARKYLLGLNATKFVSLLDAFDLSDFLTSSNKTILAPTNEVIDEDDIPNNQKRQWLSYHLLQQSWEPSQITDGALLKTEYNSSLLNNEPQRVLVSVDDQKKNNIRFGDHSKVIGNSISIGGNVIYRLSDPLSLPIDIFTSLVVDLSLSTFLATLYVSGTVEEMKQAKAMTLFAPTNEAFQALGLVSRYLVHPSSRDDLRDVLRYHLATRPLYYQDLIGHDTLRVATLAHHNATLTIHNDHDQVRIGSGRVEPRDLLVSNGVVHTLDRVQIPDHLNLTHANLLHGIRANTMFNVLKHTGLLADLPADCILLTPTDAAFEAIDMETIWNDTKRLERIARLHVLTRKTHGLLGTDEYETMQASEKVVVRELGFGIVVVGPMGERLSRYGRVLERGNTTEGAVLEIDSVLFPVERGIFGLSWIWSTILISAMWIVVAGVLLLGGYIVFKKWRRKRDGYETIVEATEEEQQSN